MPETPTPGSRPGILLLDIEGTTTPVDFVFKTLFPFARERIPAYSSSALAETDLAQLQAEYEADLDPAKPAWNALAKGGCTDYILWLMSVDRKSPALKSLQGKIWQSGYLDGSLRGEVYSDVAPAMSLWNERGGRCCIYSSGSVLAQQLLFRHSTAGDLTGLISAYFDTQVGPKRSADSYRQIIQRLEAPAEDCLFVSDIPAECDAALQAGMHTRLALRPGAPPYPGDLITIRTFYELFPADAFPDG